MYESVRENECKTFVTDPHLKVCLHLLILYMGITVQDGMRVGVGGRHGVDVTLAL